MNPLLAVAIALCGSHSLFAQIPQRQVQPRCGAPELITFSTVDTDTAASFIVQSNDSVYLILYTKNFRVVVNAPNPNADGANLTTGAVTLHSNGRTYEAVYAGPSNLPFGSMLEAASFSILASEFQLPATIYLRVCDQASNCRNTNGATLRVF